MGVKRDTILYNSAITACEKGGQWEHALRLLEEMGGRGVERNTITYNAAISACAKGGQWEHALWLLEEMGTRGVERDTITYSAAISACEQGGQFMQAVLVFRGGVLDGALRGGVEGEGRLHLDLLRLPSSAARVAIASALELMRAGALPMQDVAIETGAWCGAIARGWRNAGVRLIR